jgi:replicative DNA helicase
MLGKYHEEKKGIIGIPTGIAELDEKLGGLKDSNLIILAGRPGSGKTALAINNIAYHAAIMNVPVAIFSLEMESESLAMRTIAAVSGIDHHAMIHGRLTDYDWQKVAIGIGQLSEAPIIIDDTPSLNIMSIRSRARLLKQEHNIGLILIDYLQLMASHQRFENRDVEVGQISKNAKALARELKIPVVLLSQLNRKCEERKNKKPILSDLRESGNIEQDSDVVLFLYRPTVYGMSGSNEIIIAKHRNGPIGIVEVGFIENQMLFTNLDKIHQEEENRYEEERSLF